MLMVVTVRPPLRRVPCDFCPHGALPRVSSGGVPPVGLHGVVGSVILEHKMAVIVVPLGGFPPFIPYAMHDMFGLLGTAWLGMSGDRTHECAHHECFEDPVFRAATNSPAETVNENDV